MEKSKQLENWSELEKKYEVKEKMDAAGKFIYPGFIDAHAHFVSYGINLQTADLVGTNSWEEITEKLKVFATRTSPRLAYWLWLGPK